MWVVKVEYVDEWERETHGNYLCFLSLSLSLSSDGVHATLLIDRLKVLCVWFACLNCTVSGVCRTFLRIDPMYLLSGRMCGILSNEDCYFTTQAFPLKMARVY